MSGWNPRNSNNNNNPQPFRRPSFPAAAGLDDDESEDGEVAEEGEIAVVAAVSGSSSLAAPRSSPFEQQQQQAAPPQQQQQPPPPAGGGFDIPAARGLSIFHNNNTNNVPQGLPSADPASDVVPPPPHILPPPPPPQAPPLPPLMSAPLPPSHTNNNTSGGTLKHPPPPMRRSSWGGRGPVPPPNRTPPPPYHRSASLGGHRPTDPRFRGKKDTPPNNPPPLSYHNNLLAADDNNNNNSMGPSAAPPIRRAGSFADVPPHDPQILPPFRANNNNNEPPLRGANPNTAMNEPPFRASNEPPFRRGFGNNGPPPMEGGGPFAPDNGPPFRGPDGPPFRGPDGPPFRATSLGEREPPFRGPNERGFRGGGGGGRFFRGGRGGRGRGPPRGLDGPPPEGGSYYGPLDNDANFRRSPLGRGRGGFRGGRGGAMGRFGGGGGRGLNNDMMMPEEVRSDGGWGGGGSFFRNNSMNSLPPPDRPQLDSFGRLRAPMHGGGGSPSPKGRRPIVMEGAAHGSLLLNSPLPPLPASPSTHTATVPVAAVAAAPKPPPPVEAPILRTVALGPENQNRAESTIGVLATLMNDPTLSTPPPEHGVEGSRLPNKQLLFQAMAKADVQTKQLQKKVEEKKQQIAATQEIAQRAKDAHVEESSRLAQEVLAQKEKLRDELKAKKQTDLEDKLALGTVSFGESQGEATKALDETVQARLATERTRLAEELDAQLVAAADPLAAEERQAQKDMIKITASLAKSRTKLEAMELELEEKRKSRQAKTGSSQQVSIPDMVAQIYAENQRKAAEAHSTPFDMLDSNDGSPQQSDLESLRDPKANRTHAEWADLARQVDGLSTALYSAPSEAPYYSQTEEHFRLMEPLVKQYVRDRQTRLTNHWTELAEEYEYRRRIYKHNRRVHHASIPEALRKPASALIPRQTSMMVLESGGARANTKETPTTAPTTNPYRRNRRGNEVRTEYEQEQIIAELAAKEAMEKKIAFGGSALPRQVGAVERVHTARYINTFVAQKIDFEEQERDLAITGIWSDMEKCIFLDRFMQHPKDFRKIASFLRNKTTRDCVAYYYDSKKTVPYKFALKEFIMRRKRRGNYHVWDGTIQAALASGAVVKAGTSEQKPLHFSLPVSDETFVSHGLHPVKLEMLDAMVVDEEAAARAEAEMDEESEEESPTRKRTAEVLVEVAPEIRKFLKVEEPATASGKDTGGRSTNDDASVEGGKAGAGKGSDEGESLTPLRKAPQKWTAAEKKIFVETLEKHGRQWNILADAVGTKTIGQIKNFYYDFKKQAGKSSKVKKAGIGTMRNKNDPLARPSEEASMTAASLEETGTTGEDGAGNTLTHGDASLEPPSFASMTQQDTVSPLPPSQTLTPHQALARQQLEMAAAPSLPDTITDQQLRGLSDQQLREIALAQQIQALQHELSAGRTPPAPLLEPSLSDGTARLLHHHSQSHHQQILSNLLPWVGSQMMGGGGAAPPAAPVNTRDRFGGLSDWDSQQLHTLLLQQQQQQHHQQQRGAPPQQQHHHHHHVPQQQQQSSLAQSLAMQGLLNPASLRLLEQQQHLHHQQRHQQQQQQQPPPQQQPQPPPQALPTAATNPLDDARLELIRQLLSGGGGVPGSGGGGGTSEGGSSMDGGSSYDFHPR